jgi:hypothetical protein
MRLPLLRLQASDVSDPAQREQMLVELARLPVEWVSFWKPALSLRLVADWTAYPRGGIPQPIAEYLRIERTWPTTHDNTRQHLAD